MLHSNYVYTNGIHYPYSFVYSTSTARLAASGFTALDVGKLAWQQNGTGTDGIQSLWMLQAITPTWVQIGTGGASVSGSATLANGKIWIGDGSNLAQEKTLSGDLTTTNAGVVTVKRPLGFLITGALTAGSLITDILLPTAFTVGSVKIGVGTAPTSGSILVDVHYHATTPGSAVTIFTTQGNRPAITAGTYTGTSAAPDITSLAAGGHISIIVDSVGLLVAGSDLTIWLISA